MPRMATPKDILEYAETIAVVGASRDPMKPGGSIPPVLQRYGFRVIPVNPTIDRLFGEKCYKSLEDVPDHIDVVQVFRPSADAPAIARQAVAVGATAVWLQSGIISPEARQIAEDGGLDYIEDHCMTVERAKYGIRKG
jgi:predicted CoA-binding protein